MAEFKPGDRVMWNAAEWEVRDGPDFNDRYALRRVADGLLRTLYGNSLTPVLPSLVEACEALRPFFDRAGQMPYTGDAAVDRERREAIVAMFAALNREQGRG